MTEPTIVLRADARPEIGLGHLRRMADLAHAIRARGAGIGLACADDTRPAALSIGWPEGELIAADPGGAWAAGTDADLIVTDLNWHGGAPAAAAEIAALTAAGRRVAVIDAVPPDHFTALPDSVPPALVVTPYLGARRLRPAPRAARWEAGAHLAILGTAYATLRPQVSEPLPRRVLVSCGGSDPTGLAPRIARSLAPTGLAIDLVVGPLASVSPELSRLAAAHPNLRLLPPQPGLAQAILAAGVVVGRLGLLRYEAAALGRSGIYLHESTAYRPYLDRFAAAGLAEIHYSDPPLGDGPFLDRLARLGTDPADFALNRAALAAVDGQGARNVVDLLLTLTGPAP
ncbi:hypothetical protein DXV76_11430 [Rhodobacteraceae bacterium CCMM004]|nr:hypothetical protein DXV76_11430 [Rhodobacteraceae bacterium CCMM004]